MIDWTNKVGAAIKKEIAAIGEKAEYKSDYRHNRVGREIKRSKEKARLNQ